MATFKITVRSHQKRRDGKYPISIRLTHRSKIAYIPTGYYAQPSDLTRTFELKNPVYGKTLNADIEKYERLIVELGRNADRYTVHELAGYIVKKTSIDGRSVDFMRFSRELIAEMEQKGMKQPATYRNAVNSLDRFIQSQGTDTLYTSDITGDFLRRYEASIKGVRAPSAYISIVRALFNIARERYNDDDRGIILIPNDPFRRYRVPRQNVARKRGMDSSVVRRILEYIPSGSLDALARDVFMLSFCLAGTNAIDIFNCKPPVDGYLSYEREKTRERRRADRAFIKIRLEPEIFPLMEKYRDETGNRAFSFYLRYSGIKTFGAALNRGLKIIGKSTGTDGLQFYAARHSWAGIARNECGIPKSEVHEYLNHVDPDLKITDLYLQKDWEPLAAANRKVMDRVLNR